MVVGPRIFRRLPETAERAVDMSGVESVTLIEATIITAMGCAPVLRVIPGDRT
jgi:hypothetical protein